MTDRVPGAPGQYKAVVAEAELQKMQAGESFIITMTRDDQPITEGTPYSKATVLPDALAQLLCPDIEDPTPADAFAALLPLSGGTMTGNINMDGHKFTGLASPTDPTDAVTMEFVQNRFLREYFGATNDEATYISFALPYSKQAFRYLGIFTSMGSNGANANMDPCVFILETGYVPSDYRVIVLHGGNVNVSYVDGVYRFQFGSGTWTKLWLKTLG